MQTFYSVSANSDKNRQKSNNRSDSSKISLQDMSIIMEKLKSAQYRMSTAKMYLGVWRQFNKFLRRLDHLPNSWEDRTTLFIAHLVHERGLQSSIMHSYITAIKRTLVDDEYDWQDGKLQMCTLARACRLINDKVQIRLPIHCSLLEVLLLELRCSLQESGQQYLQIM